MREGDLFSGRHMARAYPATVRRVYEEGHTIGTHSETHPLAFWQSCRSTKCARRSTVALPMSAPRLAIPDTWRRSSAFRASIAPTTVESELAARSLIVFQSDTVADDWHRTSSRTRSSRWRSNASKRAAKAFCCCTTFIRQRWRRCPGLLKQLKDNGFHIVQVVPAASYQIEMAGKPKTRTLASAMPERTRDRQRHRRRAAQPAWPKSGDNLTPDDITLPAPDASAFDPDAGLAADSGEIRWPDQPEAKTPSSKPELAAPRETKTAARRGRQHLDVTGSIDHEHLDPIGGTATGMNEPAPAPMATMPMLSPK